MSAKPNQETQPKSSRLNLEVVPLIEKLIKNVIPEKGSNILIWLHNLQGQLNFRPQIFLNSEEPIEQPKIARFFNENLTEIKATSDLDADCIQFHFPITESLSGLYLLKITGIVGSDNTGINLIVNPRIKSGDKSTEDILPVPLNFRVASSESRVPYSLQKTIRLGATNHTLSVNLSCTKPTFGKGSMVSYFASVELVKID